MESSIELMNIIINCTDAHKKNLMEDILLLLTDQADTTFEHFSSSSELMDQLESFMISVAENINELIQEDSYGSEDAPSKEIFIIIDTEDEIDIEGFLRRIFSSYLSLNVMCPFYGPDLFVECFDATTEALFFGGIILVFPYKKYNDISDADKTSWDKKLILDVC